MEMSIRNRSHIWNFRDLSVVPAQFQSEVGGYSIVSQTLLRRGINKIPEAQGFLNYECYQPSSSSELPGLVLASERIWSAIKSRESILIWGDFDVDGQTSTALLKSALIELGAEVSHYIPNRATESHGMSSASLANLIDLNQPDLILTCDTGIDAFGAIELANNKGIDVIITDHHQLPDKLPRAKSIINPVMLDAGHPLSSLPGVGVAYKLVEEIYKKDGRDPTNYLDLVALGIVADVAVLTKDTRYLLQLGLEILRNTSRLGLKELYKKAKLKPSDIREDQIGFAIAPRLNALGRLSDANSCVDFFTSSDILLVKALVDQLEALNLKRQSLTEKIFQEAQSQIQDNPELDQDFPILVLKGPHQWNPGVIGIVASRLVERYKKPVIMLTEDGKTARGSARSVAGIDISGLIGNSSSVLTTHGGHPMAAGLSLPLDNVAQFRRLLSENFIKIYGVSTPVPEIFIDAELPFQAITNEFIVDFNRLAPFGAGNPKLLFAARDVSVLKDEAIGKDGNHRKLKLSDSSNSNYDFLYWNSKDIQLPRNPFDIAFSLDISSYRNQTQAQATLQHFRETQKKPVYIGKTHKINLNDYRNIKEPVSELLKILDSEPKALVWSEYIYPPDVISYPRHSLSKTRDLIIWTSPPNRAVLKTAVDQCAADTLHFFSIDPGINSISDFLEALLGLLKHLDHNGKEYDPNLFAQRIASSPAAIEAGLVWLHYHGDFDLSNFRSTNELIPGKKQPLEGFDHVDRKLKLMLQEILSFRTYFKSADLLSIL